LEGAAQAIAQAVMAVAVIVTVVTGADYVVRAFRLRGHGARRERK
jgi:alpha-beta hydrolase superfamily lysophospholipase